MPYPKLIVSILLLLVQILIGCTAKGGERTPVTDEPVLSGEEEKMNADHVILRSFDFARETHGWKARVAGYPRDAYDEVEFYGGLAPMPPSVGLDGQGLELRGTNISTTLFMYMVKAFGREDGLRPGGIYDVRVDFRFASGASGECLGAGGSPGSVHFVAGVFQEEPKETEEQGIRNVRPDPFLDEDAYVSAVDIDNGRPCDPQLDEFTLIEGTHGQAIRATADSQGNLYAIVGLVGGFMGETRVFLKKMDLRFEPL